MKGLNQDLGIADEYYRSLDPTRVKANTYEGEDDTKAVGDSLAVNLARTHAAATHAVPRLAEVFGKASESISSATGSGAMALGPAYQPWEELCNRLQRVTAITGNHLYEGGHNLAEATVEFARQDGIHAKWVNETIEPVEHIEVPDVYTRPDPNLPPWMR
ncbi:hypothetical protein [Stackebrandtia nassauensis]|uniref:Uncharacterized protein n=1 Tax=Stackebrandtia nassauensis (strain DSM 44728 / CIP 108903 / NRRL B-16338 / NBRC 102104 / LLR-40K-21) TaxID=446470 RepID=D3Q5S7_STANL|nr:hypothetical protein [Stackebrandtia nassauensis]ADD40226.1 hypothetical protein Snas_0511 [Stackebrandtia nassauensis DSM 44728]